MKKLILTSLILLTSFLSFSFADMKDNFFCIITPGSIVVTLERQNNYKCAQYLKVLSQAINKEYRDVLEIQDIIKQGYDVEFWTAIREDKRERIKKILLVKNKIEDAVNNFNGNLFAKIKEYLIFSASPYQLKYIKILRQLNQVDSRLITWSIKNKMNFMQEQVEVIDNIISATDYDFLIKNFNRYVYLKKQIEGK